MLDPVEFGKTMAAIVREATAPLVAENEALRKRIDALEARQPEKGDPGPKGDDGEPVLVADVVAELVATDALAPVLDLYATEAVAKHFEANPVRDGKDGLDGAKGDAGDKGDKGQDGKSVTIEDVSLFLDAAISKHVLDLERRGNDAITKAIERIPAPKDGKDGADFTNAELDWDGERTLVIRGNGGEIRKTVPVPLDRGYYREGMLSEKGDILTHDGNAWIALRENKSKPCHENKDDWRLFARRGRDGRDMTDRKDSGPVRLNPDA